VTPEQALCNASEVESLLVNANLQRRKAQASGNVESRVYWEQEYHRLDTLLNRWFARAMQEEQRAKAQKESGAPTCDSSS